MKFLKSLTDTYNKMELQKPEWLVEADGLGAAATNLAGQVGSAAMNPATNLAGQASKSVVDTLMNAMKVVGSDNPNIQKAKQGVLQAKGNAEKVIADTSKKVIDKINQAMGQLTQATSTTGAAAPTPTTPGVQSIPATPTSL